MSKIVIEESLHLFDKNIYLKQDWKQGQSLLFAVVASTNSGRSAVSMGGEKTHLWWVLHSLVMGHVLRVELCPFWFFHWKNTHEKSLLIQHLVQCWFIAEIPQRCSEHSAAMKEGSQNVVFAHFSVSLNVTLWKTHVSWLWVNYYFMKMWHHYSKLFLYLFLSHVFFPLSSMQDFCGISII